VPFSAFNSSRWIGSNSAERSIVVSANLIASLVSRSHGLAVETVPKRPDLVLDQYAVARMFLIQLWQVDAGAGGNVVAASLCRPIEQARGRAAHLAGIAHRRLTTVLTRHDVIREHRNIVLGDLASGLSAQPAAEEVTQMARNVFPAFVPRPPFPVRLEDWGFHPLDPLLDDLIHGLAMFYLLHLVLAQGLRDGLAAHGFQAVDLAAGILDRESFGGNDAEPASTLFAGLGIGEFEREGRHAGRGDADI
jgi:hypothetical protein